MNLSQFKYFVLTIKYGSYASAAEHAFVTAPAISRAVHELEKKLDMQLVERAGRTVIPTRAGKALYRKISEVLSEIEDIRYLAKSPTGFKEGGLLLAVAASANRGRYAEERLLKESLSDRLASPLSMVTSSNGSCISGVEEGTVDAAIVLGRTPKPHLTLTRLYLLKFFLIASSSNPFLQKKERFAEEPRLRRNCVSP